ncbi:helix-turn-helix DNA binding protein [Mycobacterium phage MalagasyRose]|uniref:Helix-turn-helix DNA binding protein n=1 Tax=Mycobacterium phage MalagasyRose TaxID=2599870 RepID=A0A5J6TDA1_9CAUD|nr:helix-turn-helix DNA binding protein [Mycobacterium phage MalagasyRose]QFG08893.1 helix-turn-helix DNA binding protein [Mycobacterium phage MalagasyRose]
MCGMHIETYDLHWKPQVLANIMRSNGIRNRADLAKLLPYSNDTINRTLSEDWAGIANPKIATQISGQFGVPVSQITDTIARGHRRPVAA